MAGRLLQIVPSPLCSIELYLIEQQGLPLATYNIVVVMQAIIILDGESPNSKIMRRRNGENFDEKRGKHYFVVVFCSQATSTLYYLLHSSRERGRN